MGKCDVHDVGVIVYVFLLNKLKIPIKSLIDWKLNKFKYVYHKNEDLFIYSY